MTVRRGHRIRITSVGGADGDDDGSSPSFLIHNGDDETTARPTVIWTAGSGPRTPSCGTTSTISDLGASRRRMQNERLRKAYCNGSIFLSCISSCCCVVLFAVHLRCLSSKAVDSKHACASRPPATTVFFSPIFCSSRSIMSSKNFEGQLDLETAKLDKHHRSGPTVIAIHGYSSVEAARQKFFLLERC